MKQYRPVLRSLVARLQPKKCGLEPENEPLGSSRQKLTKATAYKGKGEAESRCGPLAEMVTKLSDL